MKQPNIGRLAVLFLLAIVIMILYIHPSKDTVTPTTPPPTPTNVFPTTNLAVANCIQLGGRITAAKRGDGTAYQLCTFQDAQACEIHALYRDDCQKGGIRITGYDTMPEKYCAWLGGQTIADPNASCTLPSGKICSNNELYNGKCQ